MKQIISILLLLNTYIGIAQKEPSAFTATPKSTSQIDVSWTDNATNETGFDLQWGTTTAYSTGSLNFAKDIKAGSITGLKESTLYYIRLRSKTATTFSAWVTTSATTLKAIKNPPTAPTGLSLNPVSATQIDASWKDNSANETGFRWECATDGGFANILKSGSNGANDSNVSITGLNASTGYYVRVWAYNADGESARIDNKTTTQAPPKNPPATPTSFSATGVSTSQINLNWKRASLNESGFKWECYDPNKKLVASKTEAAAANFGSIIGLIPNTVYTINLWAFNNDGNSAVVQASATTQIIPAPTAPTSVSIAVNNLGNGAVISWKDNSADETGFDINWGETEAYGQTGTVAANITSFQINSLKTCSTIYVRVRAKNGGGFSGYASNKANTNIAAPAAPSALALTPLNASQITATWKDNSTNEAVFVIQISEGSNFANPTEVAVKANDSNYTFTALKAKTVYYLRVKARNCGGESGWSESKTTTPGPPNAPTGLTISVGASGQEAKISWTDNSSDETEFLIKWGETENYGQAGSVGANISSFTIGNLNPCTLLYVEVYAKNANGNSSISSNKTVTNIAAPTAPTALALTPLNASQITVTWKDNSTNEDDFVIQLDENENFTNPKGSKEPANTFSHTFSNLKQNTLYYIRVKARNCGGESAWVISKTTTLVLPKPAAPTILQAGLATSDKIPLKWADNSTDETGFEIHRSNTTNGVFTKIGETLQNENAFTDINLNSTTQYCYKVLAKNAAGNSLFSNTICKTTEAPPLTKPNAPTNLTSQASGSDKIVLNWSDNANTESGFEIERASEHNGAFIKIADINVDINEFIDNSLSENTQYCYQVRAKNSAGYSVFTNKSCATTLPKPLAKPISPTNLKAVASGSTSIVLEWNDKSNNESGFEIERADSENGIFSKIIEIAADSKTFVDDNLTSNTNYCYKVIAKNAAGYSTAYSNIACSKTTQTPILNPNAPSILGAIASGSDKILLSWIDNANNEDGFIIERADAENGSYTIVAELPSDSKSFLNENLSANSQYCFKVLAKNTAGNSAFSNISCTITDSAPQSIPKAPINAISKALSKDKVEIKWEIKSDNESGFEIERATSETDLFSKIGETAANIATFIDENLTENTQYCYKVRAVNITGKSLYSNNTCTKTLEKVIVKITAPKNLKKGDISNLINEQNIVWENTFAEPCHIEIWRATGDVAEFSLIETLLSTPTANSFTDKNLRSGINYSYKIRAVQPSLDPSEWSNILKITAPVVNGEEKEISFNTFPNPVTEKLTISLAQIKNATINILNLNGELLKSIKTTIQSSETIDLSQLYSGVYLLNISTQEATKTIKILKQ